MPDYIPTNEAEKIQWLTNFAAWLTVNGAAHGFTPAEIAAFNAAVADASTAVTDNVTAQAAAKAATANKNTALAAAVEMARDDAQRVQDDPNTTNGDRGGAGITIPDTTPTTTAGGGVLSIPAPLLLLDFSVRRQVTVHWGTNPANEHQNHRPAGTIGCQIQAAIGGIPATESGWVVLEIDTDSPMIHTIHEDVPTTYAYRACYVGKNLKLGPFGDPVVCTVSV